MAKIKFVQGPAEGVLPFEQNFESFSEVKEWVLDDKKTGYGDILAYKGVFTGLTEDQIEELSNLTLGDAL